MSSKKPVIGTIFSSDSSDDNGRLAIRKQRVASKTSASDTDTRRKVRLKVNVSSGGERYAGGSSEKPPIVVESNAPEGYITVDKTRLGTIRPNTLIQYEKNDGKMIKPKYFKRCDPIASTILVGFYSHNKRNYSEQISNIKEIYMQGGIKGGSDALKETIEIESDQWKNLRRDMIISYEKEDHEYVFKAKFNSFIKGPDGSTRMSMTSERGFSYIANPIKILKIFRHVTGNDKTLTYILESLRKLEGRIRQLEMKQKK